MDGPERLHFIVRLKFKDNAEGFQMEKTNVFHEPSLSDNRTVREWLFVAVNGYINSSRYFRADYNSEVGTIACEIDKAARKTKINEQLRKQAEKAIEAPESFYERSLYSKKGSLIITASADII